MFPTGFTGITAMVAGFKQIGWSPKSLAGAGWMTSGYRLPGAARDGRRLRRVLYPGTADVHLLTPENTALAQASQAKIGLNPQTSGVLTGYFNLLAIKWAIEKGQLPGRDQARVRAQLRVRRWDQHHGPGPELDRETPSVHNGFPSAGLKECDPQARPVRHPLRR